MSLGRSVGAEDRKEMKFIEPFLKYLKSSHPLSRIVRIGLIALFCPLLSTSAISQWRTPTPRDTLTATATQKALVTSKILLNAGVEMLLTTSGTFSENDGSTFFALDAAYTYLVNGLTIFPQLKNPPTYNSKTHLYAFTVTTIPGLNETPFSSLQNGYQSDHLYTSRVFSQGNKFQFRILADKDADYPRAAGSINVKLARWTAGISIQYVNLDFGNVQIGSSARLIDSLASYGIDPLQIDSIKVFGLDSSGVRDYSFISERDNRFILQSEQTDELKVSFSPSVRGTIRAELHIFSHNTDPASKMRIINLTGFGIAPDFGVGPHQFDFGRVRIGFPATGFTQISNFKGNTTLTVTNLSKYVQYQPASPSAFTFDPRTPPPITINAGSLGQVLTQFSPTAQTTYRATLYLRGNNVPADSVEFTGVGARPVPELSPVPKNGVLDFGNVYNGNTSTRTITLTNKGNWTASVIIARITGPFGSVFSFSPMNKDFLLEPDSSRTFTLTYQPGTGTDSLHMKGYFELVYDDFSIDTLILNGIEVEPKVQVTKLSHNFGKIKVGAWRADTITYLRNTGNIPVRLQTEEVRPNIFFKEVGTIGQIDAGKSVPMVVKFAPLIAGPATAYAYIASNGKADSVLLTGIGAIGKALFTPSPVNYGIVPSNHPDTIITTLKDSGDFPLRVIRMEISGQNATDFTVLSPIPIYTVHEDSSIEIKVRFYTNALTGQVHTAKLCLFYDDSSSDCIPLQAIEEAQHIQFGQSSIDFRKRRVRTHTILPAVFRNGSNTQLSVGTVTANSASNVFTLVDTPLRPIKARSSDSVSVDFYPVTRGMFTGTLNAFGGDFKTDSIQLRGQGAAPMPEFSDSVVDFGIVKLGVAATPKQFSLVDTGDWPLAALKIELVGDKYSEFGFSKTFVGPVSSDTIPELKFSLYDVAFTPKKTTVYHTAKIVFTFDDGTSGFVTLKGYDESPLLVLDDDSVNFGFVRVGKAPATHLSHLVSTSPDTLTAQELKLVTIAPLNTFKATPSSGPLTLDPRTLLPINLAFAPPTLGQFSAQLIIDGKNAQTDTIYITGIGATPMPVLSSKVLDFGSQFAGYAASRSFTVKDGGNWQIDVIKTNITGPNNADFSLRSVFLPFDIAVDSTTTFIVDFKASTAFQAAPRTAQLSFLLDDSTSFIIDLIEQDIAPIAADLKMDNNHARIGDVVTPSLRLMSDIPDSLHIIDLKGVITYDPSIVDVDRTGIAVGNILVQLGNWNLITNSADAAGTITYELKGSSAGLNKPGSLLRLKFKARANNTVGATTKLTHTSFSFPLRSELLSNVTDGVIIIDSSCGEIQLVTGPASANIVNQNHPNPFGSAISTSETLIPFDIGSDHVSVTIIILDPSGREIARPLDNVLFSNGRYAARVSASSLGSSGTYFYEFRAGDDKPVFKKMVVSK